MLNTLYRILLVLFTNSRNYKPVATQPTLEKGKHFETMTHSDHHYEIFSSIIRLCSNLVHINKEAQDTLLKNNQLKLFLCVSESNEENPMVREWSVVLVRNLTESNPEI